MRPLKRPMFKYGGDVKKQGIMHGMNGLRDGGVATTMADATGYAGGGMTMPDMRGRVTGPGGYAGKKEGFLKRNYGKLMTGAGAAYNAPDILEMLRFFYKDGGVAGLPPMRGMVTGPGKYSVDATKFGGALKGGLKEDIEQRIKKNPTKATKIGTYAVPAIKAGVRKYLPSLEGAGAKGIGYLKNFYNTFRPKGLYPKVTQSAGSSMKYAPPRYTTMELMKNPKLLGQFIAQNKAPIAATGYIGSTEPGQKIIELAAKGSVGIPQYIAEALAPKNLLGLGINVEDYVPDVYGKLFKGKPFYGDKKDKGLTEEQKQIKALQDQIAAMNEKKTITGKPVPTEEDKLKRIYSLLGVDRAQRGAASKALADMSRYIDEGGKDTISRKNIGSTLTKGILAFDKRLDKVDQLKEAAGLMMAKGEIEAMSNPLAKEVQRTTIDVNRAKLDQAKDASTVKAKFQSTTGGGLTSPQAAKATAQYLYKNKYVGDIVDDDTFAELIKNNSKKGKSERETIVSVISGIAKDQAKPNGIYTAGDVIFEITDQAVSKIIVG